jgi:transcriptional regulator with XRE-family HTH domain
MNQAAFARELGVSQAQLSRYEKGKSEMGVEVLLRISRRFGKPMEWVLRGKTGRLRILCSIRAGLDDRGFSLLGEVA